MSIVTPALGQTLQDLKIVCAPPPSFYLGRHLTLFMLLLKLDGEDEASGLENWG